MGRLRLFLANHGIGRLPPTTPDEFDALCREYERRRHQPSGVMILPHDVSLRDLKRVAVCWSHG